MEEMMDAAKLSEENLRRYTAQLPERMANFALYHEHVRWLKTLLVSRSIASCIVVKIPGTDKEVPFRELYLLGLPGMTDSADASAAMKEVEASLKASVEKSINELEVILVNALFAHEK